MNFNRPQLMGIINCTPDSFYAGNRHLGEDILPVAQKHVEAGATMLDIGGQSTRPGSARISAEEEAQRVSAAIRLIRNTYPDIVISVDTFYGIVAEQAVEAGADLINDVTGASIDPLILQVAGRMQVPYILTHLKGNLDTMQVAPHYDNLLSEMLTYFIEKIRQCEENGIKDIIIDLGFGFGKTLAHNYKIMAELETFHLLNRPLLVGVSRKSMVQKLLNVEASEALNGTTILHTYALEKGAHILRVHDVKEAMEVIKIREKLVSASTNQ
jgi:dihydropteroate synthase